MKKQNNKGRARSPDVALACGAATVPASRTQTKEKIINPAGVPAAVWYVGSNTPRLMAQSLSIRLENGGELDLTIRKDCLGDCLNTLRDLVPTLPLNDDMSLEVTLHYWQLDEDMKSFDVEVSAADYSGEDGPLKPIHVVNRLIINLKTEFLKRLATSQVVLTGPEGKLEVPT